MDLLLYPRSKVVAEQFHVVSSDDVLEFPREGGMERLPYSGLTIERVVEHEGEITEIWIRTPFRQIVELRDLERMGELQEQLRRCISGWMR